MLRNSKQMPGFSSLSMTGPLLVVLAITTLVATTEVKAAESSDHEEIIDITETLENYEDYETVIEHDAREVMELAVSYA